MVVKIIKIFFHDPRCPGGHFILAFPDYKKLKDPYSWSLTAG
jgi:hypothetical protein